jgi:hypothetical protein
MNADDHADGGADRGANGVDAARGRAYLLYEGRLTPHRSCGIAIAETFGLPTRSYQALRRGGLTGEGTCGAVLAGTLVLGELLGDPDPTGAPTPDLRAAVPLYRARLARALAETTGGLESSCNARVATHGEFGGDARRSMCTGLAAEVAAAVAGTLVELGHAVPVPPTVAGMEGV